MKIDVLLVDGRSWKQAMRVRRYAVLTDEHAASSYGQPVLVIGTTPHGPGDRTPLGNPLLIADEKDLREAFIADKDLAPEPKHIREWNERVNRATIDASWLDEEAK